MREGTYQQGSMPKMPPIAVSKKRHDPFAADRVNAEEISELYTIAASRGDIAFMRELRDERDEDISVHACLAVFLHAVDIENVAMLKELAHAKHIGEVFANPWYAKRVRDQIYAIGNRELINAVCALPGMNALPEA